MKRTRAHGTEPSVVGTQQAINSLAVTVGGIYLATHSVTVTVVGATASTLLTGWTLWLAEQRNQALASDEDPELM
jgi:hypothetical protein